MLVMRVALAGAFFLALTNATSAADSVETSTDNQPITGAGAHFSWVIFNDLKPSLEHKSGRSIHLYGRESMLGMGCNAGIKTAKLNRHDHETFGFVCCDLAREEQRKEDIVLYPIANEPILILVHRTNPVTSLSVTQLRAMFRGEITNWKQVGGTDRPVVVVTRLHCKNRPGHWKTILSDAKQFRQDRLNVKSAAEMVKTVSDFPGGLGHTGSTWIFDHQSQVKAIRVGGVAPTAANLKSGKYPFYRQLGAVTSKTASTTVKSIIEQVQTGPEFRKIARK
jgi:ABC-type phosphate transport system substrate-binding protein